MNKADSREGYKITQRENIYTFVLYLYLQNYILMIAYNTGKYWNNLARQYILQIIYV